MSDTHSTQDCEGAWLSVGAWPRCGAPCDAPPRSNHRVTVPWKERVVLDVVSCARAIVGYQCSTKSLNLPWLKPMKDVAHRASASATSHGPTVPCAVRLRPQTTLRVAPGCARDRRAHGRMWGTSAVPSCYQRTDVVARIADSKRETFASTNTRQHEPPAPKNDTRKAKRKHKST